jgi:hypothetical protein
MYLADSDEEIELVVKFSNKKVTFNEKKNQIIIFNEEDPVHQSRHFWPFPQKRF